MSNKNNPFGTRGAIAALVLFAVAIGLTSFLYTRSGSPVQEVLLQEPEIETLGVLPAVPEYTQPSSVPTQAAPLPEKPDVQTLLPEEPTAAAAPAVKQTLKTASPVSGSTINDYAVDCLSYNETTRDWRIHNGIDLAAEDRAPVCAAADGTVYTTYEDDTMGFTVVIRHEGGYTTRYSSLAEDLCVQAGDNVTLGQTIGYASDSALVETVMGSHVHFSVSYQDQPMNPEEFFALS